MSDNITIEYRFEFDDGSLEKYPIEFDARDMSLIPLAETEEFPDWTKLEFNKCENCPLNEKDNPRCPVAANISNVVEKFKEKKSFVETKVVVLTKQRGYFKKTSLQEGIFSIMGLIMATSDCPNMNFLKPFARFHLPFATSDETIVRSISMFFLSQYINSHGEKHDLSALDDAYTNVGKVNRGMIKRIRAIAKGDADVNAITVLDSFATLLSFEISNGLSEIESLFK